MEIIKALYKILDQLDHVLTQLSNNDINRPVKAFSGGSIGQHFRHSIEFIQCLMVGYDKGLVNYDIRERSVALETNTLLIQKQIDTFRQFLTSCDINRSLELNVNYNIDNEKVICIKTNMERELAYNIEHIIHHMALVKIGVRESCPDVILPNGFGIAVSTLKYQSSLEQ